jgi:hypothetical protein
MQQQCVTERLSGMSIRITLNYTLSRETSRAA